MHIFKVHKYIFIYKCTSITHIYMLKYSTYLKYINKQNLFLSKYLLNT